MLIKDFTEEFGNRSIINNRFVLSTYNNKKPTLSVDYNLALKTRLHVLGPKKFYLEAFDGRLQMSLRMLDDIKDFYKFSLDDCLRWINELENRNIIKNENIDLHFQMGHKKTNFRAYILQNNKVLSCKKLNKLHWVDDNMKTPQIKKAH